MSAECAAGRTAFFGGRWNVPCPITGRHRVGSSQGGEAIMLCDDHFRQVNEAQKGNDPAAASPNPELHAPSVVDESKLGEGEFYRSETATKKRRRFKFLR